MVEPPANFRRGRVFKIDDHIFIAIEVLLIEQRARPVHQAAELKIHVVADPLPVETGKQRSRCSSIEALIVKEDPDFHSALPFPLVSRQIAIVKSLET